MIGEKKNALDRKALKQKYLECFGVCATNMAAWQEAVKNLTEQGVSREMLVNWAVAAGYSRGYVSSLLSHIFCSLGLRKRGAGAGRKPSPDALELLAYARSRFGERFRKVLRAAWRAGNTRPAGDSLCESLYSGTINTIVAPQLGRSFSIVAQRSKTREVAPRCERRQSLSAVFKGNSSRTTTARNEARSKHL
jgi:hypothetical protein